VPYEDLLEMDEANSELATADVAIVVGANDTVNPAATNDPSSPIYGMPIIHATWPKMWCSEAFHASGFAGIDNELLYNPRPSWSLATRKTLTKLVAVVKSS